ncbi:hypothetical protein OS493_024470 [Desmophyllum pertusum]|uniref:Uncharacterized protein n=1 Tax=Desmophyllum pertusum TaxID=174260 RepID=A0A9W9YA76_9CNID|nr:hypothetical protein OS493_024470 [Desmophyllum pertusum]
MLPLEPLMQRLKTLEDYNIRAVNLNGALLSKIAKCGRKDNIAVVLAIKDVCGKVRDSLARLPEAIVKIVANFARAAVVGGLPKDVNSDVLAVGAGKMSLNRSTKALQCKFTLLNYALTGTN